MLHPVLPAAEREPAGPVPSGPGDTREYRRITEEILGRMGASGRGYLLGLAASAGLMLLGTVAWGFQLWFGMGLAGLQHPMMWAVHITNFVWWIGIAHSGTLISAILFLFRASFRPAFSRAAEAMTVIAIITSSMYPVIHLGRAWRAYWLFPYPNQRDLWITFRSPLVLDVFALGTDLAVSVLFFWLGLLPDLAIVRDRSKGWRRTIYGLLSLGWEGRGAQWKAYRMTYSLLAALAIPLVIWVHSVVSWDFSVARTPGWHSTIFPPYFVAGAVFSGLAMVLILMIPMRALLRLERYITTGHLEQMARIILAMSLLVSFSYAVEYFMVWFRAGEVEKINLLYKATGPFAVQFWVMTACNSLVPLALFWPRIRRSPSLLILISVAINVGMWLERFLIVTASLARDHIPYAWAPGGYRTTLVEWGIFLGSAGWFILAFLLFARYLPVLPIAELKKERLQHRRGTRAPAIGEAA